MLPICCLKQQFHIFKTIKCCLGVYTGSVLETDRRNIDVKNRNPLVPPGTSARIMKNSVPVWTIANNIVKTVLCMNIAKYNVPTKLPAYVPDRSSLDLENACLKNSKNPLRKQKLKLERNRFSIIDFFCK